jgi:hypothetical protein
MANPALASPVFVPDVAKVKPCPRCGGTKITVGTVTWERGRDRIEVKRSVCAGCGEEFLPIYLFTDWDYFVCGGKRTG